MKFLDSNIVLYAYLKPKEGIELPRRIIWRKERSKKILKTIDEGREDVLISTVHIGEILNILSKKLNVGSAIMFLARILNMKNIVIAEVDKNAYQEAVQIAISENLEPNDALALAVMNRYNCDEILTFDSDFYGVQGIKKPLLEEETKLFEGSQSEQS